jgi:hypothetical protein
VFVHLIASYPLVRAIQSDRLAEAAAIRQTVRGRAAEVRPFRLVPAPASSAVRPECPEQRWAS